MTGLNEGTHAQMYNYFSAPTVNWMWSGHFGWPEIKWTLSCDLPYWLNQKEQRSWQGMSQPGFSLDFRTDIFQPGFKGALLGHMSSCRAALLFSNRLGKSPLQGTFFTQLLWEQKCCPMDCFWSRISPASRRGTEALGWIKKAWSTTIQASFFSKWAL